MTGKQSAVLWLGLLLVVLRMFTSGQWTAFWGSVVTAPSSAPTATANHSSAENGSTGSVTLNA